MEIAEASIEFQRDGLACDTEGELAKSAVIVFPAVVLLREVVVAEHFDGITKGALRAVELARAPFRL